MISIRSISAAAVLLGVAVASAGSAWGAGTALNGTYKANFGDGKPRTWVFSSCGDACLRVHDPDTGWTMPDLHLASGQWTTTYDSPEGVYCPDGTSAPATVTYSINPATLSGTVNDVHAAECGLPAGSSQPTTFTLTPIG